MSELCEHGTDRQAWCERCNRTLPWPPPWPDEAMRAAEAAS